jgi:N-dimethylarginine dimethylaminohydrolase
MTVALVRRTSSRLAEGLLTHIERQPVDIDLARKQWASYVQTLSEVGWNIVEVPELNSCADSVFIEDTVVIYGDVAIITNPGNNARKPEIVDVEPIVRGLGLRIHYIDSPGTLDGGDVLKVGQTVYVGRGGRTNQHGIDQFAEIVKPLGATVVTVPTTKALHLKSAVTALTTSQFFQRFCRCPKNKVRMSSSWMTNGYSCLPVHLAVPSCCASVASNQFSLTSVSSRSSRAVSPASRCE